MKVFDFDNTLYHGESSVDLALYMIRTNKKIIKYLPSIFFNLIKYKLCMVEKKKMIIAINDFLKNAMHDKDEIFNSVDGFWQKNRCKLDKKMLGRINKDDVIITAGPDFLIYGIRDLLNTDNIICSRIDADRMKVKYLNFGDNKVKQYKKVYGDKHIDCFYTDSFNDIALMDISDKVYLVKKGSLKRIK